MNVLDTDLLVANLRNEPDAVKAVDLLEGQDNAATTITEMELWYGECQRRLSDFKSLESVFNAVEKLPLDSKSARIAGGLWSQLKREGKEIEVRDVMIAAIALRHDATLYTRNVRHFGRIAGLKVKRW